jgi:hypothetical protein
MIAYEKGTDDTVLDLYMLVQSKALDSSRDSSLHLTLLDNRS